MSETRKMAGPTHPLKTTQWALLSLFLIVSGLLIVQTFTGFRLPISEGIWDAILLILALSVTLVSLCRQLPFQNVFLAAVIISVLSAVIHDISASTAIPFGPVIYTDHDGPKLFAGLPWFVPLFWVIALLNARGVARLILRPWRKLRIYGFWLIGITTALTLIFALGLEPLGARLRHYWIWTGTKLVVDWYGTPLSNFLGWLVTAVLILAFTTPSLMKKKPAKSAPDYHPLIVWVAINLLFIAAALSQHFLLAAAVIALACATVVPLAVRGARW